MTTLKTNDKEKMEKHRGSYGFASRTTNNIPLVPHLRYMTIFFPNIGVLTIEKNGTYTGKQGEYMTLSNHQYYLVGGLEPWNFMTFHSVGNGIIIPTDELIFFLRGRYTTNQKNIGVLI